MEAARPFLTFLLCLSCFYLSESLTKDFTRVKEANWVLKSIHLIIRNVPTSFDCLSECLATPDCNGGHWNREEKTCGLMKGQIAYRWKRTTSADYVFVVACKNEFTYAHYPYGFIREENDKIIRRIPISGEICINDCNMYSWCKSVDMSLSYSYCILSASNQYSGQLLFGTGLHKEKNHHYERLCWAGWLFRPLMFVLHKKMRYYRISFIWNKLLFFVGFNRLVAMLKV